MLQKNRFSPSRLRDYVLCLLGKGLLAFCLLHVSFTYKHGAVLTFGHWYTMLVLVVVCLLLGVVVNVITWALSKLD